MSQSSTAMPPILTPADPSQIYRISPLIRVTLLLLYVALTAPLPVLAAVTQAPVPPVALGVGLGLGAIALYGALSEQVTLTAQGITVSSPGWLPRWVRRGWALDWTAIQALRPRSTGQGGLVYYFVSADAQQAYLLPMRVAGFARLVRQVQAQTGLDMTDVRPLSQPWMYLILLVCTVLLLAIDAWVFTTALTAGFPVA